MEINSKPAYKFYPAFEVKVEEPEFDRELLSEDKNWIHNKTKGNDIHYFDEKRKLLEPQTADYRIWQWVNKIVDKEVIYKALAKVWEESFDTFYKPWPYRTNHFKSPEEFLRYWVLPMKSVYKDEPGYSMHAHYDNRAIFGNIFINMVDNDCSTLFYEQQKPSWKGPTKKGTGIFFLNDENLYHTINHEGVQDRYILVIPLTLSKMFEPCI